MGEEDGGGDSAGTLRFDQFCKVIENGERVQYFVKGRILYKKTYRNGKEIIREV